MKPLYSPEEARFLAKMENIWKLHDEEKVNVILQHLGRVDSFLDVGCGSGQMLKGLSEKVPNLFGVGEVQKIRGQQKKPKQLLNIGYAS